MKKITIVLIFAIVLHFNFSNFCFADELRNVKFHQVIESVKQGKLFEAKTWMKDGKVRMEYMQGTILIVTIIKEDKVSTFSPISKQGTLVFVDANIYKDQIGPKVIQSKAELQEFLEILQAKKTGKDTIDGKDCLVYQYSDMKNQLTNKMWILEDEFFPIKSTISAAGDVITLFYNDIELNQPIEDSFFEVPEDIVLQDFTQLAVE